MGRISVQRALLRDRNAGIEQEESLARIEVVRKFLETEGPFQLSHQGFLFGGKEAVFQGIHLPEEVLEKIYFKNFVRFAGVKPHPLHPKAIVEECGALGGNHTGDGPGPTRHSRRYQFRAKGV